MTNNKGDNMKNSNKIPLDKYYTPSDVAKHCTDVFHSYTGSDVFCIEPSCGNGSFIPFINKRYDDCLFLDIAPEHGDVQEQDYLTYTNNSEKPTVVLGNPPFGSKNSLIVKFFKSSVKFADYIGFILPISQLDNTKQLYEFDLIYSEDLGKQDYSGVLLHCCFNIYKRPESGKNNKKREIVIPNLEVIEYRRDKNDSYRKKVKPDYFKSICSWGSGSLGKEPTEIGQYSMELYFYSKDEYTKEIVNSIDWYNEVSCISMKKLPKGLALEIIESKLKGE